MIEMKCPECGSSSLIKFGKKFVMDKETGKRIKNQQFQCKDCGRITVKPLESYGREDREGI